jgi:hypothetical protein
LLSASSKAWGEGAATPLCMIWIVFVLMFMQWCVFWHSIIIKHHKTGLSSYFKGRIRGGYGWSFGGVEVEGRRHLQGKYWFDFTSLLAQMKCTSAMNDDSCLRSGWCTWFNMMQRKTIYCILHPYTHTNLDGCDLLWG